MAHQKVVYVPDEDAKADTSLAPIQLMADFLNAVS